MRDDQQHRVVVLRANVDEVDVETVDLGHELRQAAQPRLQPPEVVLGLPVAGECTDRRELDALRQVVDGLLLGPARRRDAAAQLGQVLLRNADVEGADGGVPGRPIAIERLNAPKVRLDQGAASELTRQHR